MANKMTTTQLVVAFSVAMAVIFTLTAITWMWPEQPAWVGWLITLILFAASMILVYKLARKTNQTESIDGAGKQNEKTS